MKTRGFSFEPVEVRMMTPVSNAEIKKISAMNSICSKLHGLEDRSHAQNIQLPDGGQLPGDEMCPQRI